MSGPRPRRPRRRLVAAVAVGGLIVVTAPVATAATLARVPCSGRATSPKFSAVDGDRNAYFTAPSGTFENGTTDWTLTGAAVVPGNESYRVNGGGGFSLRVDRGGQAVSPEICNRFGEKGLRFFYTGTPGARVHLHLDVTTSGSSNRSTLDWEATVTPGTWRASSFIDMPALYTGGFETLRVTFTAPSGTVQVDDVEIDPWKPN